MKIAELFAKDINRDINGVIKVGQLDDGHVRQELEEYVLTAEVRREFTRLFEIYVSTLNRPTDRMGLWISGFFGSGKSHFLKLLSYLLANRAVGTDHALDFFRSKVHDAHLWANMERSAEPPAQVILFNIDAEATADSKTDKEAIVRVFQKVFDNHLGYFGTSPKIARFERILDEQGKYELFQQAYERYSGVPWKKNRDAWDFYSDAIVEALKEALGMSTDAAQRLLDNTESATLSAKDFAVRVKAYLDRNPSRRLIFMVDEVGQYIGSNSDLMLNLQTVVEELGIHAHGRAWVMVTSQEDLDSLIGLEGKDGSRRRNDFSKIQGRFLKPVSLSSANTDEVIQLRILEKTPKATETLRALYEQHQIEIGNLIDFEDSAFMAAFTSADSFAKAYPFVPYQFNLLQDVFTAVRRIGASGRHLASGERSMLDAFQIASRFLQNQPVGSLAPFHLFYQAIEGFLDGAVRRVIERASDNPNLKPFDRELLKTLFMIKYVKNIKGNMKNLTTLSLTQINQDRIALKKQVEEALARLERETLIQRDGDTYEFLTDDEQDVGRSIKQQGVDPGEVVALLQEIVWEAIFTDKTFKQDRLHSFGFNRKLDDQGFGRQQEELILHVVSPTSDWHLRKQPGIIPNSDTREALIVLPNEEDLIREANLYLQTEKYIRISFNTSVNENLTVILQAKQRENQNRKRRLQEALQNALTRAEVFVSGRKIGVSGTSPKAPFEAALEALVSDNYPKLSHVKSPFDSEAVVDRVFNQPNSLDLSTSGNAAAQADVLRWLSERTRFSDRVTIKNLIENFQKMPYGWPELDTLGVMAELASSGKIELRHAQGEVRLNEHGLTAKLRARSGLDTYTIRVPRDIDPTAVRIARDLARDLFKLAVVPTDPRELVDQFQKGFKQRLGEYERWLEQARRGYPFAATLEELCDLVRNLLRQDGVAGFLDAVLAQQDDLDNLLEREESIQNFYKGQIHQFDQAKSDLSQMDSDLSHLQDELLLAKVREARAILSKPDPSRDIPKLAGLLSPVATALEALREQARGEAHTTLKAARSDLEKLIEGHQQLANLLDPLTQLGIRIDQASTIDAAIARKSEVVSQSTFLRTQILQKLEPTSPADSTPRVQVWRLPRRTLATQVDLEQYLGELRDQLEAQIQAGIRITLE